jgi:osmoprotectant transport system substrate-binding protein
VKSLTHTRSLVVVGAVLALLLPLLVACGTAEGGSGGANTAPVKIGTKNFPEQLILGEMYALLLEEEGIKVERKFNLAGTPVLHEGLKTGEIDLYPEYTGTGLLTVLKLPTETDRQKVYDTVSREYKSQFNLVWLDPAPMNNTQALAMTRDGSARFGITTISQMAAKASELRMIGPPEFAEREDGLPGIKKAYGDFTLKQYIPVDPGLKYKGLVDGQADVAVAFGTDGEISAFNLVVLEDDKNLFPPYPVAPVVRQQTLDANPKLKDQLNKLAPKLTDDTMRRLNNEVSGNQKEPAAVAKDFLTQEGLIKKK